MRGFKLKVQECMEQINPNMFDIKNIPLAMQSPRLTP